MAGKHREICMLFGSIAGSDFLYHMPPRTILIATALIPPGSLTFARTLLNRKLLKLVETLQLEAARHREEQEEVNQTLVADRRGDNASTTSRTPRNAINSGSDTDDSNTITREDLRRLRVENRNMHLLLVENRELKNQVRMESVNAEKARTKLSKTREELEGVRARLLVQEGVQSRWGKRRRIDIGVMPLYGRGGVPNP